MRKERILKISKDGCDKCGLCVKSCPYGVIALVSDGAELIKQNCKKCGNCVMACSKGLVTLTGFHDDLIEDENGLKIDPNEIVRQIKESGRTRQFSEKLVSREEIENIIGAGKNCGSTGVSCVVLQKNIPVYEKVAVGVILNFVKIGSTFSNTLSKVDISDSYLFRRANLVIVVKSDDKTQGFNVVRHMETKANSLGLAVFNSILFTTIANKSPKLKKMLKVSGKEKVVSTMVIGYPKSK